MSLWQHWMVGQVDATIAAALMLGLALLLRHHLPPQVRSVLLLIALVRLVLPPWIRSPWSEALADVPPIDDTRLLVTGWLSADTAFLLFAFTATITLVLLTRLAYQSRVLAARLRALPPAPSALQATVERLAEGPRIDLRLSPDGEGPFAAGIRHRTIVLPSSLTERLDAAALEAVLAHEVAHHARYDLLWIAAARVLAAVAWFNPFAHVIARALVASREDGCDDWAVSHTSRDPFAYAHALLQSARLVTVPPAGISAGAHPMGQRLRRLLDGRTNRTSAAGAFGIAVVIIAAAACLPGAHMPVLDAGDSKDDAVIVIKRVLRERGIEPIRNR